MSDGTATCIDIILAIILPPLGVFFKFGCGVRDFLISTTSSAAAFCLLCCSAVPIDRWLLLLACLLQVEFWICLILTFLGYLPGIIYAVWAITK
jgi:uncharacterized membrane protein YqaE (UPF0057 family)